MRSLMIVATIALCTASTLTAQANEAVSLDLATRLDNATAEYSMTAAKQRRLMIIEESLREQHRQQRGPQGWRGGGGRDRNYDDDYRPRPSYGYGPPRGYYEQPFSGYAPPPPRYGYGPPPPPYGYDYGPPPRW